MAIRYDQKKKDEVVAFVEEYNQANNRGGQSAAAKKFGISPITINSWLKKAGVKKGKSAAGGRKRAGRKKAAASTSSVAGILQRMADIQTEIDQLQSEFDALKGQL